MRNLILPLLACLIFFSACKNGDGPGTSFEQEPMLQNLGENIILPAYRDFNTEVQTLNNAAGQLLINPDTNAIIDLRNALKGSWLEWQRVSAFEFGPAEAQLLRVNLNTFPTDTSLIESNISGGAWDLDAASNLPAKGFPALDYMLNAQSSPGAVLQSISQNTNRKNYFRDVVAEIVNKTSFVLNEWEAAGGAYIETFKAATGTDVGSSVGMLVNQYNQDFELMKNVQIGIPSGIKTLNTPLPEKVEAFYGNYSAELIQAHFDALEDLYYCRSGSGDGVGLDDYLTTIDAQYNGGSLNDAIIAQLNIARPYIQNLTDPFSEMVVNNNVPVLDAYTECQKLVVLLKADMPSALGVLITYTDNDGD